MRYWAWLLLGSLVCLAPDAVAQKSGEATLAADKAALAPLQDFVGTWKGVGQPKRGSTQGAWTEQAVWAWQFQDGHAALVFEAPKAKYYVAGRVTPGAKAGEYRFTGRLPEGDTTEEFTGQLDGEGQLVLSADKPTAGRPARMSLRLVAEGKRLVILLEQPLGDSDRFLRLAEIGYTREGSGFGSGPSYPECVVTGGFADREVEYKGVKYKICCEGCRELFNMDPEGVLAEYRERKAKEKEEREKK